MAEHRCRVTKGLVAGPAPRPGDTWWSVCGDCDHAERANDWYEAMGDARHHWLSMAFDEGRVDVYTTRASRSDML